MLDALLSDDTEYDVFEENDEFIIEIELILEEEALEDIAFGECDDMDYISDDDDVPDDDPYCNEIDDDDDII